MRMRWLARLLLPRLKRWAGARKPNFEIIKDADPITFERLGKFTDVTVPRKEIYLQRWWLVPRNDWMNVYLHRMIRDDDAVLHDHSYWSLSLVLSDGLEELWLEKPDDVSRLWKGNIIDVAETRRPVQGDLVLRTPRMAHQLKVLPGTEPWTIFVTGPRVKSWGFYCKRGWKLWSEYVKVDQTKGRGTGTSGIGVGCGED